MNVPLRVFCFWTDHHPMSDVRRSCLEKMQTQFSQERIELILVTQETLDQWVLADFPIHPAYECLSATHRSDYLRCYFMHLHGGGYSDVKTPNGKWIHAFKHLNEDPHAYLVGYREVGPHGIADSSHPSLNLIREQWYRLVGCGAFACRSKTPLTTQWFRQLHHVMDENSEELEKHPATEPREVIHKALPNGRQSEYPLRWAQVLSEIFHPICFDNALHLRQSLLLPNCETYL